MLKGLVIRGSFIGSSYHAISIPHGKRHFNTRGKSIHLLHLRQFQRSAPLSLQFVHPRNKLEGYRGKP
jgi:hypothetical protein